MQKINWTSFGKSMLPLIIPMLAIIIFHAFNVFIKGAVFFTEGFYGLGQKLGNFLEHFFNAV
ncbi:hypothetical protein [Paenibacillus sp. FSL K6-1318]|uniref:hypothetical protein n=1 Tax=Paenibacillus sp. FSL K6-1318 TaxID=2975291 RepID=UPI0030EB3FBF